MPVDPRTACLQLSAYSFLMKARVVVFLTSSLCCLDPIASTTVLAQNRALSDMLQAYLKLKKIQNNKEKYFFMVH